MYRTALDGIPGVRLPEETPGAEHVYHLYVIRVNDREKVGKALGQMGIATGVHYPAPIHRLKAYAHLGRGPGSFPASEAICEKILSLPMYPEMGRDEVDAVAAALRQVMA
jgi:dTDP-4-amino-4,6-dideoxygalactose transaminase